MILHNCEQGSVDWLLLRAGIPTASEFDQLVTPKGEVRKGQMPESYLAKKIAEWWMGGPLAQFSSFDVEQGQILENEARPWFTLQTEMEVEKVGFITTDSGQVGCSPDGLVAEKCGLEIKCPQPETHVKYLLAGKVPDDYVAQVQGSLWVTKLPSWRFLSYRRRFPALLLEVLPDPDYQETIEDALESFLAKFEAGKARLIELNGGEPPRRAFTPTPKPAADFIDKDDIRV